MATIDHDFLWELCFLELFLYLLNAVCMIVGLASSASENGVSPGVAFGLYDGSVSLFINPEKVVGGGGRLHGVDGYGDAAIGAVFIPDGHG